MSNSTDKPGVRNPDFQAQEDQEAIDPGAGTILEMEALDAISAGNNASSDAQVLFGLQSAQQEAVQKARNTYRQAHPYAHPDDVEKAIKDMYASVGLEGKSGA